MYGVNAVWILKIHHAMVGRVYEQLEDYDQSGVERSSLTKASGGPDLEFVGHVWGLHVKVGVYNQSSVIDYNYNDHSRMIYI